MAERPSRARTVARLLERGLLWPLVVLWPLGCAISTAGANLSNLGLDFHGGLYNAGVAIVHGRDPYRAAFLAHQAAVMRGGAVAIGETSAHAFSIPLYPAAANVAVVPLSLLPYPVAAGLYTLLSLAAMLCALRLLGVHDRRCLAAALISWPFLYGIVLGAIGPFLLLGMAAAWRWRDRLLAPALATGAIVAAKLFPWPIAIWLLITGRRRAFAWTVAVGAALTLAPWALTGFAGFSEYPRMLSDATFIQEGRADSPATLALWVGASPAIAQAVALIAGLGVLGLAARVARAADGERRAFGLAVIACLLATPIVWDHYMVLLFVPIALCSPRRSRLWLLPLVTSSASLLGYALIASADRPAVHPTAAALSAVIWLSAQAWLVVALARGRHFQAVSVSPTTPARGPRHESGRSAAPRPVRARRRRPSARRWAGARG